MTVQTRRDIAKAVFAVAFLCLVIWLAAKWVS